MPKKESNLNLLIETEKEIEVSEEFLILVKAAEEELKTLRRERNAMRKALQRFADADSWTHGFTDDGRPVVIWDDDEGPTPQAIAIKALKGGAS